ncbi:UNVERIFIED_CONTAM: hypothetical protein FKN15_074521 [Acipenser sinensis]
MESIEELIERINRNTAAQIEQTARYERWAIEMGLAPQKRLKREPTELERLIQAWKVKSIPPPQPRPPPLRSSSAPLRPVPHPLLQDTLPVFPDLPVLDLEPRSVQHWPQLFPWFPASLSPNTQTSLGCCQTSLLLPLFAASLPLGDRTSLRWSPGEDLCPLLHPPVPRSTLRSPLLDRGVPLSLVRGPCLAGPGCGPIHPQVRPWKRAKKDIYGLEGQQCGVVVRALDS